MMAAAAGSPAREELTVPPAAQPRRGASAGPTPTLLHDSALHSATNITAASTALITPESVAASLHSSVSSPTGTKLAVTTPSESPAGGEGARITLAEEKKIALSQLQELEVAIEVRRVTKVDGRKIRWIEYRARKQAEEEKQPAHTKKRPRRSRSKTKGVENSENEANVNNNNNNNKTDSTMKGDSTSSPLSVVGTSNVLESMKQQFLQGTENIEEPIINGKSGILAESSITTQKRKSGRPRKSTSASEGGSPSSTSPKKLSPSEASPKGACLRSCGASKGNSSANSSISEAPLILSSTPTALFTSDQPLAIGIKKNFFTPRSLTKGLREVRKMENGTDGVSAVKTEEVKTPLTSLSASLHLTTLTSVVSDGVGNEAKSSADSKPQSVETKATKTTCPLIKAAAKLMSPPTSRSKSADSSSTKGKKGISQKGSGKKVSTKSGPRPESEPKSTINGHNQMVQNGSSEEETQLISEGASSLGEPCSGRTSKQGNTENSPGTPCDSDPSMKRPRGRPPKRKLVVKKEGTAAVSPGKSGKKLATLVVDVHNTMNGEPQTVIPVSRPVLRGKRASSSKNPSQTIEKSPDIKHSPVPAPKRQKNEAKLKLDNETLQIGFPNVDTKKGKTGKKNNDHSVDVKEEKGDTSASTVNQIQMTPDHTQSTKHTKGVQRTTNREVPSECESSTAMSSNLNSNNKKKVKKPTLKVKMIPAKHKEIEKIVKKSRKAAGSRVNKQNRAQPKKNNIRKYLCTQKGKSTPKIISTDKKECSVQVNPKNSSNEDKTQGQEGVSHKLEQHTHNSDFMDVQPIEENPSLQQENSVLKTETTEIDVQKNMAALKFTEEDSNLKSNLAAEVPCIPSPTVPAGDCGEETSVEEKPHITNFVPQSETETHPPTDESSTTVNILGIDKSYEKVSDLPKISFQNNDNINNNNAEEEGVVICDKEITVVKDLSVKKLSSTDDALKCIAKEECSLEKFASKTKRDTKISKESIETVLDLKSADVRDGEHQILGTDSEDPQEKDCPVEQNSFQEEIFCTMSLQSEENVCDKSESCVETMPGSDECHTPTHMVTLDSSEIQNNGTLKESILSSSSLGETPKEIEVPSLEAGPGPASNQSPPDSTASNTTLHQVSAEVVEEVAGCGKLRESQSDPEEKIITCNNSTEEVMLTTGSMEAKEIDPTENNIAAVKTEVNQALDSTNSGDCELQILEVQTGTLQDQDNSDSVALVSQKSSPKQVKKREGSIVRKKTKKGLVQSHSISRLEHRQDVQEESEDAKITKAQEASQEAGAGKIVEISEVLDTLPPSQKEIDEAQDLNPEVQPTPLTSAPEVHSSSATKTKDKVPRILKQLFQDEGVQNMLKSMGEDSGTAPETSPNSDSGTHKLRPKRVTEPMLSSSPELDAMELLLTSSRKKKRGTELDTLYIDEGVLNLLTSKEQSSRRMHQEDAASDVSQASSSKSFKASKTSKSGEVPSDTRKRKLSGASTSSNTSSSSKSLQPPEPKKVRVEGQEPVEDPYELDMAEEFKEKPVIVGYSTLEATASIAKKKGLPVVPLSVKQKNKAIKMQLKLQKQKQLKSVVSEGSEDQEEGTNNVVQVPDTPTVSKEVFPEASSLPASVETREVTSKSVPPLKIKLASDSVTIKPVPRPSLSQQPAEVTIVAKPPPVRLPVKHQMVNSTSPPLPRPLPLPQVRTSPEKPRPHPDRPSPSQHLRRVESLPGPVPPAPGFSSLVRNGDATAAAAAVAAAAAAASKSRQRVGGESVRQSQRASVRQSEANYHFRDIALRKFNNFTQIILSPSTTKMKNALNSRVLRELCEALNTLKRDESVRMVLLTGTGSTFCQGVDLTALQHPNLETRKKNAENLVRGIKDFLKALVQFPKPIIAGVNGNAMGLGVTMLPLFDMVIANDKAEFCLPYAKLGQVPEGGATYTFPNLCGKLQSTQLFLGHKLTAHRAQEMGLVSESIWPATYQQELIPKVALLATQSAQSMEATKALMNHHLVTKLELSLESECRLLLQQWTSPHFAHLCKRFLDSQYIHLQKPVSLPL